MFAFFYPSPIQLLIFFVFFIFIVRTFIIRKIRASYEPFVFTQPVPIHFCTHCGKPVSENASTCTSCGAVPTGYRNFCGQCGLPLNPEQIVCIRCGANVTSGMGASPLATLPPGADMRKIKDYLEEAIIDLFLILPLGITAIIFSFRTLNAKKNNDYYRAVYCSTMTKLIVYAVRILVVSFGVVIALISLCINLVRYA